MNNTKESRAWYEKLDKNNRNPNNLMTKKMNLVVDLLKDSDKLLDVGCGSGELFIRISNKYKKIVGVEINEEAFSILQKKIKGKENATAIKGTVHDVMETDFDTCVSLDVLEHIDDPAVTARKIYQLLKNDGQYIITVPNWYDFIWSKILKLNPFHVTFHTIYGWRKILENAGFEIKLARSVKWPFLKSEFLAKKFPFWGMCLIFVCKKK